MTLRYGLGLSIAFGAVMEDADGDISSNVTWAAHTESDLAKLIDPRDQRSDDTNITHDAFTLSVIFENTPAALNPIRLVFATMPARPQVAPEELLTATLSDDQAEQLARNLIIAVGERRRLAIMRGA